MTINSKHFNKKQFILDCLSDGQFHSGQILGEGLGISRAAVAKHVKQLTELGVDVFSVKGRGYQLSKPLILLSGQKIEAHYQALCLAAWQTKGQTKGETEGLAQVEVKHVIASTNEYLLAKIGQGEQLANGQCVVAECQSAGRGRRGKSWVSPFGSHVYFSMVWQFEGIQQAMGLSLAVGMAVRAAIQPLIDVQVKLKWPNDLLVAQRKIAGILVEVEGQTDGPCDVVIGIGINVNMPASHAPSIDQPWTDINSHSESPVDRNALIAGLILHLQQTLRDFSQNGLQSTLAQWQQYDHYYDQPVELLMGATRLRGICKGIDKQGGILLLAAGSECPKAYYGGEISLREGY